MDSLPGHLLDKVLFRIDLRALAMVCCTNTSLQSHIHDPYFVSQYFSRIESGLLRISTYGSNFLGYHHPHGGARSLKTKDILLDCHILGVCSGLLLLFIDSRLCVANPLTKKFRFLNHSNQMMHHREALRPENKKQLGLAVNQIDRTTQSFKLVYIFEMKNKKQTRYGFEIYAGNSWRCSRTTITCHSSNLDYCMMNPVYFDGSLHWLRKDGSIVAFNPETEHARLIPVKFPQGFGFKMLFAAGDNSLTLISATEEVIYVYALKNILSDPKWVLVKQIQNGLMGVKRTWSWYVQAYNGKFLVLCEGGVVNRMVHVYDLRANKWVVMGSVPAWCDAKQEYFHFTPSPYSVVGLDEILACGDSRISSLSLIMALIDGSSSENVEKQLRKRSAEEEEKKLILANIESSGEISYEQYTNKKRRMV